MVSLGRELTISTSECCRCMTERERGPSPQTNTREICRLNLGSENEAWNAACCSAICPAHYAANDEFFSRLFLPQVFNILRKPVQADLEGPTCVSLPMDQCKADSGKGDLGHF